MKFDDFGIEVANEKDIKNMLESIKTKKENGLCLNSWEKAIYKIWLNEFPRFMNLKNDGGGVL